MNTPAPATAVAFPPRGLQQLIDALLARGFRVLGPRVREDAVVYEDVTRLADLPAGVRDVHEAGRYRLEQRGDGKLFGYVVGPHAWKRYLMPPRLSLWRARREGAGFTVEEPEPPPRRLAFLGVRACELAAIAVQDRVMLHGRYADPHYRARREGAFLVALQCSETAATCFCASMGTGPAVKRGYDIALTELHGDVRHLFVARAGTPLGAGVLEEIEQRAATPEETDAAARVSEDAARAMGRHMDTEGLPALLESARKHPRWDDVAVRCLACANCTMVCPTCFCTSVEDWSSLDGAEATRTRRWDSCFTTDFSYLHGGAVRTTHAARYRQWLTHKLGTWVAQFGSSGCVGCGRCITWCPAGIDITEEVAALRAAPPPAGGAS